MTPNPDLRVRSGTDADVPALAKIRVTSWHEAYTGILSAEALRQIDERQSSQGLRRTLAKRRRGARLLVVESRRDGLLGYSAGAPTHFGRARCRGEIQELYLDPTAQRRGIGRLLLSGMIWELVALGLRPVIVRVLARNPARFFYAACGGELVEQGFTKFGGQRLAQLGFAWRKTLPMPPLTAA